MYIMKTTKTTKDQPLPFNKKREEGRKEQDKMHISNSARYFQYIGNIYIYMDHDYSVRILSLGSLKNMFCGSRLV